MRRERWLRRAFGLGLAIKGVDGLLETVGGAIFLLVSRPELTHFIFALTRPELLEDPDDWVANHLRNGFSHLSAGGKIFAGAFLLGHGVVKLGLVAGLWRDRRWSFPVAIGALMAFVGYQVYRLVRVDFSIGLAALTALDGVMILLIWHEFRAVKRRVAAKTS